MNFADLKEKIVPLLKKNDVVNAAVFGSYARGEEKPSSRPPCRNKCGTSRR
ncbi:hypothetical protein SAMN05660826_00960 [Caldanaerovirga acetigignens]|uniref:Nucleotidyltransferase domain-containing protein n=2 Tax=Caldanaerovirga acetigignens TaxID=447595 RepID=A0A1M7IM85_9FIRM|nr:hypothetical protein SAMN05660826_00960 [Caldanaerovirga acetigignens]